MSMMRKIEPRLGGAMPILVAARSAVPEMSAGVWSVTQRRREVTLRFGRTTLCGLAPSNSTTALPFLSTVVTTRRISSLSGMRILLCCAPERARQARTSAPDLCAYREGERQCDLTKPMMALTAGPSCLKNPCAPCALQGFELGAPVVLIHCSRALPPDQATKLDASLGSVNRQTSWLWWTTRVAGSTPGEPSVAMTRECMPETKTTPLGRAPDASAEATSTVPLLIPTMTILRLCAISAATASAALEGDVVMMVRMPAARNLPSLRTRKSPGTMPLEPGIRTATLAAVAGATWPNDTSASALAIRTLRTI